jgi:hypothetical protein
VWRVASQIWRLASRIWGSRGWNEKPDRGHASSAQPSASSSLKLLLDSNFGPNTTTFVIPGEIYPAEVRATCHGLSAASGKLGAATGAYFFPMLLGSTGSALPTAGDMKAAMYMCSVVAALGAMVTFFLTPQYDSAKLEDEAYLELDFACFRPSDDLMREVERGIGSSNSEAEMLQIVHSAHDYALDAIDGAETAGARV